MSAVGSWELGKVCILLNNNVGGPSLEDKIHTMACEAAERISTTAQAQAKLAALFEYYMNRAVETAKSEG